MWIRLEKDEIDLILKSVPEGTLAEKLRKPVDPDTEAFVAAVETSDDLEVDPDTVVSRGDEGAFVMSWTWISNEKAGLPPSDGEEEGLLERPGI
ncbi:hypothetical protein [Rhizobium leguminosarum]|jgi:hypothetical protein|uniref:hypothetical protein n=1 Tax=Rhizobium leguminosarum TaxID=384 RepID=UPI0004904D5B|nr:hypothetical protein [Rhizobium leguminosarum]